MPISRGDITHNKGITIIQDCVLANPDIASMVVAPQCPLVVPRRSLGAGQDKE